jgi:hypothetical protein
LPLKAAFSNATVPPLRLPAGGTTPGTSVAAAKSLSSSIGDSE